MALPIKLDVEGGLPGFFIQGVPPEATPLCVLNEGGPPVQLFDRIIKWDDQPWDITFHWQVGGPVADALGPFNWVLNVYLLKLSPPGGSIVVPPTPFKVPYKVGTQGPDNYNVKVQFNPGKQIKGLDPGVYELHTSIDNDSPAVLPITLFGDGPCMKFYKL